MGNALEPTFEWQKLCSIVTPSLRKDTHTTTGVESFKNSIINLGLIDFGGRLEGRPVEVGRKIFLPSTTTSNELPFVSYILTPCQLSQSIWSLELPLQSKLFRSVDLQDLSVGCFAVDSLLYV